MTLVEFLEARIAEDEAQLAATPRAAQQTDDFDYGGTDDYLRFTIGYGRAIAELEAKRAILAECREDHEESLTRNDDTIELGSIVLYALATVYKDHPDYCEDWSFAT